MYRKESGRVFRGLDYKKDNEDLRDYRYTSVIENNVNMKTFKATLPDAIDHTANMSPVKDQGWLGSCVSFAVTARKEWEEQKEHKEEVEAGKKDHRDEKYYDLSEAWLYWMAKKIDAWPEEEGTSIRYALKVLQKIGVPCEKAWPYDDINYGKPAKWANLVARWSIIDSYLRINSLDELKGALVNGPVPIGIGCYEEIFNVGPDGIVAWPANPQYCYGGHAVCAVGFSDRTGLVKIKNSWGKNWGQEGYGYLYYKYIQNWMWDAWTTKDLSVTKEMLKGQVDLFGLKK